MFPRLGHRGFSIEPDDSLHKYVKSTSKIFDSQSDLASRQLGARSPLKRFHMDDVLNTTFRIIHSDLESNLKISPREQVNKMILLSKPKAIKSVLSIDKIVEIVNENNHEGGATIRCTSPLKSKWSPNSAILRSTETWVEKNKALIATERITYGENKEEDNMDDGVGQLRDMTVRAAEGVIVGEVQDPSVPTALELQRTQEKEQLFKTKLSMYDKMEPFDFMLSVEHCSGKLNVACTFCMN